MKNLIKKSAIVILLAVSLLNFSFAKNPMYSLSIQNLNYTSSNALEFDIYLLHTNSGETKFEYFIGQYFLNFNSEVANGGELKYTIVSSELPQAFQPQNPVVFENQLRLAMNPISSNEDLPVISDKGNGTLVARMKLETTAKSFSSESLDLELRNGPDIPFTKICTYAENKIVDITNAENSKGELITEIDENNGDIPDSYSLSQCFPNPFNPSTTIKFAVPELTNVKLTIYDITGREVMTLVNKEFPAGSYEQKWDASNFASGFYFYRIKAGSFIETKRMLLIK